MKSIGHFLTFIFVVNFSRKVHLKFSPIISMPKAWKCQMFYIHACTDFFTTRSNLNIVGQWWALYNIVDRILQRGKKMLPIKTWDYLISSLHATFIHYLQISFPMRKKISKRKTFRLVLFVYTVTCAHLQYV